MFYDTGTHINLLDISWIQSSCFMYKYFNAVNSFLIRLGYAGSLVTRSLVPFRQLKATMVNVSR